MADRAVARVCDYGDGFVVERVVALAAEALVFARFEDLLLVFGVALLAQKVAHGFHFFFADVCCVHPVQVAGAGRDHEHVAHAEQMLGAGAAEDGHRVLALRDLERDPGREIGLDHAGDDVDAGSLGCEDHMDARRSRFLRKASDAGFDVLGCDHHQVGEFVDDDHHRRQLLGLEVLGVGRLAVRRVEENLAAVRVLGADLALSLGHELLERKISTQDAVDSPIVGVDVSGTRIGKDLVAPLHFIDRPAECQRGLLHVGYDRQQHVRNPVEDL